MKTMKAKDKETFEPLKCLLCGRELEQAAVHPQGIQHLLICNQHPEKRLYEGGFVGFYGDLNAEYQTRIHAISSMVSQCTLSRSWVRATQEYFSLILEISNGGLLLIYPVHMAVAACYFPATCRAAGVPTGLVLLTPASSSATMGPCDEKGPKPGLDGLNKTIAQQLPISALDFDAHPDGSVDHWVLVLRFEDSPRLRMSAAGWGEQNGNCVDATDIKLTWFSE